MFSNLSLFILSIVLKSLILIILLLVTVAFFTLLERKLMSAVQRRRGPNVIGFFGLLQAIADGVKLILKETVVPSSSNPIIFVLSPIFTFILALMSWVIIPFNANSVIANLNLGVLYFFAISSLSVYTIIMAGWSSNSKYAFLGALRSAAQMISYEIAIGFTVITVFLCAGSLNLSNIVFAQKQVWYFFPLFPMFLVFFISSLAETNRHPFDLPEAEAELVSGYNVEYSAMGFALFFLGEYGNILMMCGVISIFFLGGWLPPFAFLSFIPGPFWFSLKILFFACLFILARAMLPRFRYDQLMYLGWKIFIPLTLGWLFFIAGILVSFDSLSNIFYLN